MGIIGVVIVVVVVVVLGVAVAYDLRARRRRKLADDYGEAGRRSAIEADSKAAARRARTRPDQMGKGPTGGPSLGP